MSSIDDNPVLKVARELNITDDKGNKINKTDNPTVLAFYPRKDTEIENSRITEIKDIASVVGVSVITQPDGNIVSVEFEEPVSQYMNSG